MVLLCCVPCHVCAPTRSRYLPHVAYISIQSAAESLYSAQR